MPIKEFKHTSAQNRGLEQTKRRQLGRNIRVYEIDG